MIEKTRAYSTVVKAEAIKKIANTTLMFQRLQSSYSSHADLIELAKQS